MILAFDTSAAHCAAAVLSGPKLLASSAEDMARGQAEALFPLLDQVLSDAGATWRDLAAVAVGTGPGNFTGIRIAVSAARGLSMSLRIPAVGVTAFEALTEGHVGPVWASVSAPRDQVYLQRLGADDAAAHLLTVDVARAMITRDPAPVLGALATPPRLRPDPAMIGRHALAVLAQGDEIPRPAPLYLREPDAAPSRDQGPMLIS